MPTLSANIDVLFTEAGDLPARVAAAAAEGFRAVEFWTTSDRDVAAIRRAADDAGVVVTAIIAEPRTNITFPDIDLAPYIDGVQRTVERAAILGCARIVVSGGTGYIRAPRATQLERVGEIYADIVERTAGSGITFLLENFNGRVDHPGALLDRSEEVLEIVRAVDSERFGMIYDLYHSISEGEDPATVLASGGPLIRYLQIADVPGRGEPGSGAVDWPALLAVVEASGYDGYIGLECYPTRPTVDAIRYIRDLSARE